MLLMMLLPDETKSNSVSFGFQNYEFDAGEKGRLEGALIGNITSLMYVSLLIPVPLMYIACSVVGGVDPPLAPLTWFLVWFGLVGEVFSSSS